MQYVSGPLNTSLTLSSGGKSSKCFAVKRGGMSCDVGTCSENCECIGKGLIKRNPTKPGCHYPNWWKSNNGCEYCEDACEVGTCSQDLIDTCPDNRENDNQANSVNIVSVVGIVQQALDDVDDIDDETANELIRMMKNVK